MTSLPQRIELFERIVRLRRAERVLPRNNDLTAVRVELERELGETLSQRMAGNLLGVSHTALQRWIKAGDLPTVLNAKGRVEVPTSAVFKLHDSVEEARQDRGRASHVLEPSMTAGRERAGQLDLSQLRSGNGDGHDRARRRNLAYHRAVAKRLRRPMVEDAIRLLWKWRDLGRIDDRYADVWEEVLSMPIPEIRRMISDESETASDLRQNSPFAGALSEAERTRIVREVI